MNFFPQSPHDLNAVSFNWNIVIVSDTLPALLNVVANLCSSLLVWS